MLRNTDSKLRRWWKWPVHSCLYSLGSAEQGETEQVAYTECGEARGETGGAGELLAYTKSVLGSTSLLFFFKGYKFPLHQILLNLSIRIWEGNAIKFGYDDHCTNINVIKFIE